MHDGHALLRHYRELPGRVARRLRRHCWRWNPSDGANGRQRFGVELRVLLEVCPAGAPTLLDAIEVHEHSDEAVREAKEEVMMPRRVEELAAVLLFQEVVHNETLVEVGAVGMALKSLTREVVRHLGRLQLLLSDV
eukprot:4492448-Prymnesium_polylepis.1